MSLTEEETALLDELLGSRCFGLSQRDAGKLIYRLNDEIDRLREEKDKAERNAFELLYERGRLRDWQKRAVMQLRVLADACKPDSPAAQLIAEAADDR